LSTVDHTWSQGGSAGGCVWSCRRRSNAQSPCGIPAGVYPLVDNPASVPCATGRCRLRWTARRKVMVPRPLDLGAHPAPAFRISQSWGRFPDSLRGIGRTGSSAKSISACSRGMIAGNASAQCSPSARPGLNVLSCHVAPQLPQDHQDTRQLSQRRCGAQAALPRHQERRVALAARDRMDRCMSQFAIQFGERFPGTAR